MCDVYEGSAEVIEMGQLDSNSTEKHVKYPGGNLLSLCRPGVVEHL